MGPKVSGKLCTETDGTVLGDGDEGFGGGLGAGPAELAGMGAEVLEKAFELTLHIVHLGTHIQDDLDTGEVYAEVAGERKDYLKPL